MTQSLMSNKLLCPNCLYMKCATTYIPRSFQISQDIKQDWPLTLIDSKLTKRKIHLRPGEMLIYEMRFVPIGRQFPLNGNMVEILSVKLKSTD